MGQIINLRTLFKNHFNTRAVSDDDLKKFSEDHLARITANNPNSQFTPILADTGALHTAYFGAISAEDVAFAVQQAFTVQVDTKLAEIKRFIRQKEGAIRSVFDTDSPAYQEFFPNGLSEYSQADKANIELLTDRFISAATTHAADIEAGLAAAAQALQTSYQASRSAQLGKKGTVGDLRDTSAAARDALETQLTKNIFLVGYFYPGDVEQCMAYFDQSFLRNDGGGGNDDDNPTPNA